MRFSTIAVAAFAGAAIAAPHREAQLIARGKLGVNQISARDAEVEKRMGPWAAAGLASLGTWIGGKMGIFRRGENTATLNGNLFTQEEASAIFAEDAVEFLSKKAKDNEAVVCVDVPYTVSNDSAAHDVGSFTFEGNGVKSTFDCFVLTAPNTFSVDLEQGKTTPDSVAVNPGPGSWNETTGILTL